VRTSDLDRWARDNHGLITLDRSGLSRDSWYRAIRSGHLIQLHPLVARLPGTPDTREQQIHAAVLAAGPQALASHRSAAHLWGIERPSDDPVDIILPGTTRHRDLDGVFVHRPADQLRLNPQRRGGIPCTNVLRTLCDLGAADRRGVDSAVGFALTARLATIDAIERALLEHAKQGRSGVTALRAAIDRWAIDHRPADSVLELAFTHLVDRHQLPPVSFHERIEGWEVDFRFIGTAVLVECDGWATHGRQWDQFEIDRRKDDDLRGAGWIPVRLTYRSIVTNPSSTADRLRRTLERWRHVLPPDASPF
jgi:very-short-patch-repair endonuclease